MTSTSWAVPAGSIVVGGSGGAFFMVLFSPRLELLQVATGASAGQSMAQPWRD